MKINGEYQLIDNKGNPIGSVSKEPILQNTVPGQKIRFTSVNFTGSRYNPNIPPIRIWGNKEKGAEARVVTSREKQTDFCRHYFTITGSDPLAVETQIEIVKRRLGVGEKPERPPLL